ncbi:MAG: hypothetical protein D6724_01110 [Armatimonadetes bacterium]|nr:MAG: hypothetical protein D6724_01110 [Armatimonadota bacterium]
MSCNQPPFAIKKGFEDGISRSWLGWDPTNDRWLVVSKVDPGKLLAAVHEFRIDGTAGNKVQVRTVVTDTEGSVGDGSETPAEADAHIRGSWPYTDVLIAGAGVDTVVAPPPDPPPEPQYSFSLAQSGEDDRAAFAKRTEDTYGKDNKGLYGADLCYRVPATNSSGDIRYCIAAIQPTVGHKLWGAARDIKNSSDKGVPKITWAGTAATRECVLPAENLIIPASGTTLDFPIAFGGAAELPARLYLEFSPTPFEVSDI